MEPTEAVPLRWKLVVDSFRRPYPVTLPMVLLVSLVPLYLFLPDLASGRPLHAPELAFDRSLPLRPAWALIYGSLYLYLILLPVLVVREAMQIRRTVRAYLMVWLAAYACFLLYPTRAPRPEEVLGEGFAVWGLQSLYSSDPPYNCLPSLHVAHSFVSALACFRVHRGVGGAAALCAALVAVSTLYTKQHYLLDVIAGVFLAVLAYVAFLRGFPRERVPALDRALAPALALGTSGIVVLALACSWVVYRLTGAA